MDIPRDRPPNRRKYILGGIALGVVAIATIGLSRLEPAAPSVDRASIWVDTVRRDTMTRQVRGPGTLVPEQIRLIPALTAGRIERKHVQPGTEVGPETVILELTNPDVQRELLEAQRQLTSAEAERVNLGATLENQRLNQEAIVAQVRSQYREAMRQVEANEALAKRELIPVMELQRSQDAAAEFAERLEIEQQRLSFIRESTRAQLSAQESQIERLRGIVQFQHNLIESMNVRSPVGGVLQELSLEEGQWVTPGQLLARVVQPGRLKAVLRVPETQANEVVIGQNATIDTRNGIIPGRVVRIDPAVQNGTVSVDVALEGEYPAGARPDLSVEGTIEIERLDDVLYVGRPAYGQAHSTVGLFRLGEGGTAVRTSVRLGRSSVNQIEVVEGLREGDVVILSDMSAWDSTDRVRIR